MLRIQWLGTGGTVVGQVVGVLLGSILVGSLYYAAATLGLALLTDVGGVAVFWPAAGVAAGILLAFGKVARTPVVIGVFAATIIANLLGDRTLTTAIGKAIFNAGEAVLVAWLLERRFPTSFKLDTVNHIAGFAVAATLASAAGGIGGAVIMRVFHTEAPLFELWRAWFLADAVGIITTTPFVLGLVQVARERPNGRAIAEAALLFSVVVMTTGYVLQASGDTWITLMPGAVVFPILLLLAARSQPAVSAVGAFIIAIAIICEVTFSIGSLGNAAVDLSERISAAQAGAVMVMLCTLVLAALFSERRYSEITLKHSNDRLRERNEHFQLALSGAHLGTFSVDLPSNRLECDSRAARLHGFGACRPRTLRDFQRFVDPSDRAQMDAALLEAHQASSAWSAKYRVMPSGTDVAPGQARWIALEGCTIRHGGGRPDRLIGVVRDMTQEKATEETLRDQVEAERQVLAKLSASVPLAEVLEELICAVEARSDGGMIASILFLDRERKRLRHGAAPHLPTAYNEAINGVEIGPNVGSCGRAAFLGEPVFVADIATDPHWANYRDLALGHGLKACSSLPIKAVDGRVLGTFAVYYRDVRLPSRKDLGALALMAHLAALAIERHASDEIVRDTRERLQLALDSAQLGVWSVDLRTGAFENDARDRRHHGHSDAFPPRTLAQARCFVEPEDLTRVDAAFAAARTGGQCTVSYRIRRELDNQPIWLSVEGTVLRDAAGTPVHLLGVTRDVTQQKRMEANLLNQRRTLERLLGALPVAIYTTDMAGHVTYCNQSAIELWGRRPNLGTDRWFDMATFYRNDGTPMPREECPSHAALERGEAPRGREAILQRFDGTRVPIMPCPTPLHDEAGSMVGVVNMMIDLAEQKQAEAALSERNAQLQIAERATLVGSFSHDLESNTLQLSPGLTAILGLPENTTRVPVSVWRSRVHPDDLRRLDTTHRQALVEHKAEYMSEYRIVRPNGETRWIEARNVTSFDIGGGPLRVVGINIDVTDRKLAERNKSLLIAELDHRVKNALACVAAIAHHTRDGISSLDEFLGVFDGRINSMANTQTLLSRSRWQGVNLADLVHSELAPCAANGNTAVDGPDVLLATDAVQPLAMVVHELVTNAAKYGALSNQNGKVKVSWNWLGNGWAPPELVIRWSETGGPPVRPPTRISYGTTVIRDLIPYELGGKVNCIYDRAGLRCRLLIPGKWLSRGEALAPQQLSYSESASLIGLSVGPG